MYAAISGKAAQKGGSRFREKTVRLNYFTSAQFGLQALSKRRIKIARLTELNDPFEFLAADLSDKNSRTLLRQTRATLSETKGILCFSRVWNNPVLWGHYADKHHGVALGFEVPSTHAHPIAYVSSRLSWPAVIDGAFVCRLLFTKFSHWSYEDEYRVYVDLDSQEGGLYFADFSETLALRRVIVGCESALTRADIREALGGHSDIDVFKARPAFKSFRIVRNRDESLWA
ncbi:MAG: DUF2971 domain-containing protein [Betaproteobacteria bacterium]|nr:MAG: DUF2971 domain-containing protein [Betaproteobacteria bacterium]